MLFEWAKTKQGQKQAEELLRSFPRWGSKGANVDNFIDLNCSYITYVLEHHGYKGFFTREQEDNLFKILNYYQGYIKTIN